MRRIPIEELIGKKYGRMTIMTEADPQVSAAGNVTRLIACKCECGELSIVALGKLRMGHTSSCGCYQKAMATKHGLCRHPLSTVWRGMKERSTNPRAFSYKRYGGRGIKVCDEWANDFKVFYDWAIQNGWKEGFEIDRINNDGNYEPSNCQFITHKENSRKRHNVNITVEQAIKIRKLKEDGMKTRDIAQQCDILLKDVQYVIYRNLWR